MPHRYRAAVGGTIEAVLTDDVFADRLGPEDRTSIRAVSRVISTVPSSSVRKTLAPCSRSRAIVPGAGWPYGFPAPADATATLGRTASRNASVDDVRLP
jgi:hypothetical protein